MTNANNKQLHSNNKQLNSENYWMNKMSNTHVRRELYDSLLKKYEIQKNNATEAREQMRLMLDKQDAEQQRLDEIDRVLNSQPGLQEYIYNCTFNTDDTMYTAADFAEELGYDLDECFIPQLGRELTAVYKANHGKLPDRIGRTNVYPAYMRVVAEAFLKRNFA